MCSTSTRLPVSCIELLCLSPVSVSTTGTGPVPTRQASIGTATNANAFHPPIGQERNAGRRAIILLAAALTEDKEHAAMAYVMETARLKIVNCVLKMVALVHPARLVKVLEFVWQRCGTVHFREKVFADCGGNQRTVVLAALHFFLLDTITVHLSFN